MVPGRGRHPEYPLPAPDSETYTDGKLVALWNNLDGKDFWLEETTTVVDGEGPSGGFLSSMTIQNGRPGTRTFTLFHFLDIDLAGGPTGDAGVLLAPAVLSFSDGTSDLTYRYTPTRNIHYRVGAAQSLKALLDDTSLTTFSDTGLPFASGDVAVAAQLGPYAVEYNGAYGDTVSVLFNQPRHHVKGDWLGLGLQTLMSQRPDQAVQGVRYMRRAVQLPMALYYSLPAGAGLVGSDDFDGGLSDELVHHHPGTGVAYVAGTPITGAPTLPLNWRLSATGDFNGDGKADILWRNTTSQKLVIWIMDGSAKIGAIIPNPSQALDANWEIAAAADFNGDGHRDLLWYNPTSGKIVLWWMDGAVVRLSGQFANPPSVGNNNWRTVAVGDFGKGPAGVWDAQDIVWQNVTSQKVVVWYMDKAGNRTSGTFTTPDLFDGGWDVAGPR